MADRYAVVFLPLTLALAGVALGSSSGDPVRALAVLVVATPCPLILAAPIAIVSGMSRAARAGVIVKGGGAIERLARARTVLLDKTGTLTLGEPERRARRRARRARARTRCCGSPRPSTRSRRTCSAEALVHAAERARAARSSLPEDVVERPGQGVEGEVEGRRVDRRQRAPGSRELRRSAPAERAAAAGAAGLVGVDGALAGVRAARRPRCATTRATRSTRCAPPACARS